ncbi:DNA (cytosine-5-)-methyltransferase [Schaedlerella arabinosiphila]|uniref:DNA (cytosine-5-)-methyltransferase n=1 Tax=Schaedlerella arabinosiphila TaxID=2044587 RepID=A0A426DR14_9FIRM|nr:DNA (cytosine-5-)-methyltransferase [Schaedlerella arabinosiphila]
MYDTEGEWKAEDVTKLTPEEIPYADAWCFGFPCFEAGTLVMTDQGYKCIEHIQAGNQVLTHKNRFRPVVRPMKHKAGEIYELDVFGVENLRVTGEHPFLVKDGDSAKWKAVQELEAGDLIAVPVNRKAELPEWDGITYERRGKECRLDGLDLGSRDFWWFVGCYMGDGWYRVTRRKNASDNYRVVVACNEEKLERLKRHVDGMFRYSVAKERTVYKVHFTNKELTVFLMQFGKGAGGKRLTDAVFNLPEDLLRAFLEGYFETDGCMVGKYHQASTISRELAYGIRDCVHKAYRMPCAVYRNKMPETCVIEGRKVRQHDFYTVRFKEGRSERDGSFFMDGYVWCRFRGSRKVPFDGYVYNMEVEDDNSYTAGGLAAHNCQDISIAGKQRGLRGKRSGIYYSIIDLIKGKEEGDKPTYLLVENVKNLLSVNAGFDFAAVLSEMDEAGYDVRWQVLNSKDFGVPQNRERVFLIAVLRSRGGREILPVSGEDGGALKEVIGGMQGYRVYDPSGVSVSIGANGGGMGAKTGLYCVGNVNPSGKGMNGCVYDARGLAPAVTVNKGQGSKVFVDQTLNHPKVTEVARCLVACYTGRLINWRAVNSGILETEGTEPGDGDAGVPEARAVLTPGRVEKRQNGRRMKEAGEPMFTLTAQDQHGVYLPEDASGDAETALPVRNGTKQGYDLAYPGDGVCLSYPKSESRRGRVGKGCSQTLDTGCMMGTVTKCGKIRRLTPRECFRLQGFPDELYERAAAVNSETQLYKQAGNAVTATVAYAVAMALPESRELLAQMEAVWEEFGDSVQRTAWEDFADAAEEEIWENIDNTVQDTAWEDFGDTAGSLSGDSGTGPDEDFDFLN